MKISALVEDYLEYKRGLGHRFVGEGFILRSFSRHLRDVALTDIRADRVAAFINGQHSSTTTAARKHRVLAGLCRYACVRHRHCIFQLPAAPSERSSFVPYIYSRQELMALLGATPAACTPRSMTEDYVLRALLLLLYGAGLRRSEALSLTDEDVDLEQAVLTIRQTKFFKTRLVPIGRDLSRALREYRRQRSRFHPSDSKSTFFCLRNGKRVSVSALGLAFRRLRKVAGVRRDGGPRRQPRIHDLRHSAAVHRVIQWYRSGADLQRLLPYLATYLGHVDLSSTQRYLTLTPELLREASRRFNRYATDNPNERPDITQPMDSPVSPRASDRRTQSLSQYPKKLPRHAHTASAICGQ